jgi:UDP-glucose 4-epimerase
MKILVTGGAGFIGSHLLDRLLEDAHQVVIVDDLSSGQFTNIEHHSHDIELIIGHIQDVETVKKAIQGVDWVFHLAALTSVNESFQRPQHYMDVNVNGTRLLLEEAAKAGVKKVILSSSCAVYGEQGHASIKESCLPAPQSPYATGKLIVEQMAEYYRQSFGLDYTALRYFNVYGERQNANSKYASVISKFIQQYVAKESPCIFGDGQQSRDFVHVSDVVNANMLAVQRESAETRTFNVGTGKSLSLLGLLEIIEHKLGYSLPANFFPSCPGDIRHSFANLDHAKLQLGYNPQTDFETGIHDFIQSIQAQSLSEQNLCSLNLS